MDKKKIWNIVKLLLKISITGLSLYLVSKKVEFNDLKDDLGDGVCTPKKIIKVAKLADHSGSVDTSWGEKLHYNPGEDVIVRHGENDYGVVKKDIFAQTYEKV